MKKRNVQLTHFVKEDRFELNLYLTYLFQQFKNRYSSQMSQENSNQFKNSFFHR